MKKALSIAILILGYCIATSNPATSQSNESTRFGPQRELTYECSKSHFNDPKYHQMVKLRSDQSWGEYHKHPGGGMEVWGVMYGTEFLYSTSSDSNTIILEKHDGEKIFYSFKKSASEGPSTRSLPLEELTKKRLMEKGYSREDALDTIYFSMVQLLNVEMLRDLPPHQC